MLCLHSGLSDQLAGLGLLDNRAVSRLRGEGCLSASQQGGTAGGKNEDEVNVSCVQLSTDWRSISEDSRGKELHVQNGRVSVRFLLDDLKDDQ